METILKWLQCSIFNPVWSQNGPTSKKPKRPLGAKMAPIKLQCTLELEGIRVPRIIAQDLLKEMDPEGSELRRKHRLKRRV